ncbi:MmgE/PrpD family protein [Acerihabitans arboris]|uniref:2-methylcitrate dehydratase n=1 Tax=Acerihabitans arboris TaxID=2691583 RepID=A0A845SH49_9GAMM|nr:MmgE/PrpD family protein [Acerihabitans arboris]NDL62008.1 2-methylcitrate dehydratase [Acerihabitans arboris]
MTLTRTLVRFAAHLADTDVPPAILHKLQLHMLDAIGCGWAASRTSMAQRARGAALALGGTGPCLVFGANRRHAPAAAAFANAFIINALDHDDGVEIDGKGLGHPGATLLAAALAALDQQPGAVDRADVLAALAAGFEVNNRLIHALQPSAERFAQVYGVAQHQAIGAAVVYGRLCRFDERLMHQAIGLAATLTCVPSLHKYNWRDRPIAALKDAVAPAAQAGVQAAIMARLGFAGSRDVLDGPQGYWRMVGSDRFAPEILADGLGSRWYIGYGSFKRYPACRWLGSALECMDLIMRDTGWTPEDIARIEVHAPARLAEDFMDYAPDNPTDAQFSLPYTLAAAAMGLTRGAAWYAGENLRSPRLRELAAKVRVAVDPMLDARMRGADRQPGARVIVLSLAGDRAEHTLLVPLGGALRPMHEEEIVEKARINLTGHVQDPEAVIAGTLRTTKSGDTYAGAKDVVREFLL